MRIGRAFYPRELRATLEAAMNRYLLLYLMAIVLLTTVGCRPRHPPHTPQPFGTKAEAGGPVLVTGH